MVDVMVVRADQGLHRSYSNYSFKDLDWSLPRPGILQWTDLVGGHKQSLSSITVDS